MSGIKINMLFNIGNLSLAFFTFLLFLLPATAILKTGNVFLILTYLVILLPLFYAGTRECAVGIRTAAQEKNRLSKAEALDFLAVVGGTLVTFALSVNRGLGPVVAAGLVGVLASLFIRRHDVAAYCGAFVGMSCGIELFITYGGVVLAGVIAGFIFVFSKQAFQGFGGKLGTIALLGCIMATILIGRQFPQCLRPTGGVIKYLYLYSVLGGLVTYILSARLGHRAVLSSGAVGLTAGLLLPLLHPKSSGILSVMVICASFAGMSGLERIPREIHIVIAGVFCAFIFTHTAVYFAGAGGKLGTIAFGSVIAVYGLRMLRAKVNNFSYSYRHKVFRRR